MWEQDASTPRRRPRVLRWLVFGLLAVVFGALIAAFASSAWTPRIEQEVPAMHVVPGTLSAHDVS